MKEFTQLERAVLDWVGKHVAIPNLKQQAAAAVVTNREYTGVGAIISLSVPPKLPPLPCSSIIIGPDIEGGGVEHGAGSKLFVDDTGHLCELEMIANGDHFAEPVTAFALTGWNPQILPYVDDWNERHMLDVYLPAGSGGHGVAGRPVLLVLHGGSLRQFSKDRMAGCSQQLAEEGFVVVTPNYRLLDEAPWPAQIEDVRAALRWVRSGPAVLGGADTGRIAVLGASAGSLLAQLLAGSEGKGGIRCLIAVSGPSDVRKERPDGGCDCPLELVGPDWPATLITHNRNDGIVSVWHAEKLHAALEAAGVVNELFLYDRPEKDHGIWAAGTKPPELLDFLVDRIAGFLRRWV